MAPPKLAECTAPRRQEINMHKLDIAPVDLSLRLFHQWEKGWFVLAAGDYPSRRFNAMTVSWGSMGIMWGRPFVQAVVRPTRHTYRFTEEFDSFTLSAFPEDYREALNILGSRSGRDGDKITPAGLTTVASGRVAAPSFAEAELTLECRKIYWDDFDPDRFLDPAIGENYSNNDYHRIYFGQILRIFGEEKFLAAEE
jgi:flavin reductase (DIM6/NTAB) family NADH-FMN oxidoreductase RutF